MSQSVERKPERPVPGPPVRDTGQWICARQLDVRASSLLSTFTCSSDTATLSASLGEAQLVLGGNVRVTGQ